MYQYKSINLYVNILDLTNGTPSSEELLLLMKQGKWGIPLRKLSEKGVMSREIRRYNHVECAMTHTIATSTSNYF